MLPEALLLQQLLQLWHHRTTTAVGRIVNAIIVTPRERGALPTPLLASIAQGDVAPAAPPTPNSTNGGSVESVESAHERRQGSSRDESGGGSF